MTGSTFQACREVDANHVLRLHVRKRVKVSGSLHLIGVAAAGAAGRLWKESNTSNVRKHRVICKSEFLSEHCVLRHNKKSAVIQLPD